MKKSFLFLAAALFLGLQSIHAQPVKWGAVATDGIEFHHRAFVSANPRNCIELRCDLAADVRAYNDLGKFKLHAYDEAGNLKTSVELLPKLDGKEIRTESGVEMKGNLYIIASQGDQKAKKAFYYAQKLDRKTLTLQGAPLKIGEGNHNQFVDASQCMMGISRDSSRFLLVTRNPYSKEYGNVAGVSVMDANMKVEWSKSVTFPVTGENPNIMLCNVDNAGTAYIAVSTDAGKSGRKVDFFALRKAAAAPQKLSMDVAGAHLSDIQVKTDVAGKLLVAGLTSREGSEVAEGYSLYSFDQTSLAKELGKSAAFPADLLKQVPARGKVLAGLSDGVINQVIPMKDGRVLLIAERSVADNGTGTSTNFNDLDIVTLMLNASGDIEWSKVIHKQQIGDDNNWFGSYAVTEARNGDVVIVYNDTPENISKSIDAPSDKFTFNVTGGAVAKVTITPSGAIKRELLFSNDKAETMPAPRLAANGPGFMILPSKAMKKFRIALLTF